MQRTPYILLIIIGSILLSCQNDPLKVDVSDIQLPTIGYCRMERQIFQLQDGKELEQLKALEKETGSYLQTFLNQVINQGGHEDSTIAQLAYFRKDKDMRMAYDMTQKLYTDEKTKALYEEMMEALKHFKFHFPQLALPQRICTYMSGFNYNITTSDATIGIGLEMYLGDTCRMYNYLQLPQYLSRRMRSEYITSDAMKGWLIKTFDNQEPINDLLHHMIFYGKLYYALDAMLPNTPDSIKIGYTTKQLNYCQQYEKNLWIYFTEKNRLFEHDLKDISSYTHEGPFTASINKECPPRIAEWIGRQIIKAYMKRKPETSLMELMQEKDAHHLLTVSRYKP